MTTTIANRIVVGIDPSPSGAAALEWAMREAVATGASLHAIRAWTPTAGAMEAYAYGAPDVEILQSDQAQLETDEQLKLATEHVPAADTIDCTTSVVLGSASLALVEQGKHSTMVVVGARSHGALSRAVLGSTSSSVVHHTTTPVVVVPEPRDNDNDGDNDSGGDSDRAAPRVIVGVDHSPAALTALTAAAEQARRRAVTLVPVFVHEPIEVPRGGAHAPDLALLEDSERHALVQAARAAGAADVQAEVLVGHASAALLAISRPQDLLVVGSRGRGGFTGLLLGSTSTQLVQHAPCPVLVVRA